MTDREAANTWATLILIGQFMIFCITAYLVFLVFNAR